MRDGVILRADVLKPADEGTFPVLVYRTPYGREHALSEYTTFERAVARGYAVVVQDVRGRYDSGGDFDPYRNEGRDGYDTIEWAGLQPWSNGSIGTFGLSYPGAVQWLAAVESPPHLKAMVPAMTFSTPQNFFYSGGTFDLSWLEWIWNSIAPDTRRRKNLPGPTTSAEAEQEWPAIRAHIRSFLPRAELPLLRDVAPYYYDWLRHQPNDPWWDWAELSGKYSQVAAAVLNLSGWYDETYGPQGALANLKGLLAARRGQRDPRAHLIIGPWVHGVDATASARAGDRLFLDAARIDYDEVVLRWMDHYLRGIDNGVDREKPVRIFVMGDDVWRNEASWPPSQATFTQLYLSSSNGSGRAGALTWTLPGASARSSLFISDPSRPVTDPFKALGGHDYRTLAERTDVLVFDSPQVEEDIEVTGPILATMYLSCDAPDTDLWVRLEDVGLDGTAWNLMSPGPDVVRASYRTPRQGRKLLRAGRIYKLEFRHLVTSNVFRKGHRIRIQISAEFFPHFSPNLHTGALEQFSSSTRKASIRIYHDRRHPSHVVLPIIPRAR